MEMKIPPAVAGVIKDLEAAGYEAYVVGGAVRDAMMGKTPHDYDVATNATPEQMGKVFPRRFQLNNDFGTVTIRVYETHIIFGEAEVVTPREHTPIAPDPEGDRAYMYWERKITAPGYKIPYSDLTMEQRRAMLGPKKKHDWRGGKAP